jgi:hypothetical protein
MVASFLPFPKNQEDNLRDYINATVGFDELGAVTHKSQKSLMQCLVLPATLRLAISSKSSRICKRAKACAFNPHGDAVMIVDKGWLYTRELS